jgi:dTDP-4-dehydrorhamnose reductase
MRRLPSPRKRLLFVTGGTGFLGRHVIKGPNAATWEIVAPSSTSADLRHRRSIASLLSDWKPTAIIHTAYRKGDRASIVDATRHVAEAAAACGARLVHVSTDAVFAGRQRPYDEGDAVSPRNDYGRDKADAEQIVAELCPDAVIARTSLLIGRSQLSNHEVTVRDAIEGRSAITFFRDEIRCPALVDDVAGVLTELADRRDIRGPIHLGGPDALSRAELAMLIAARHGWDATRLRLGEMGDARRTRPARVVLDNAHARSLGLGIRGPLDL